MLVGLFTTDFSPHSDAAFEQAERLAAARGVKLIVLHVCNMPDMDCSTCTGLSYHEELKLKLDLHSSSLVELDRVFSVANPAAEICRVADELDCCMIVMGVTNKSGSDRFIGGCVHDYVEKNAKQTVVTLCQRPEFTSR